MASKPLEQEFDDEPEIEGVEGGEPDDQPQTDDSEPEISEDAARRAGWKSRDEFKGDAEDWTDWRDFLDVERKTAPQLRHRLKVANRKIEQLDKRDRQRERDIKTLKQLYEAQGYERAKDELEGRQRAAAELGDVDAFDAAKDQLKELDKQHSKAEPATSGGADKAFMRWHAQRGWYGSDSQKTAALDAVCMDMGTYQDLGLDPLAYLEEAERRAKEEFPMAFDEQQQQRQAPAPRQRSAVAGVSERRGNSGEETFENLPREARQQFDRFEKMGEKIDKAVFTKLTWASIKAETKR